MLPKTAEPVGQSPSPSPGHWHFVDNDSEQRNLSGHVGMSGWRYVHQGKQKRVVTVGGVNRVVEVEEVQGET